MIRKFKEESYAGSGKVVEKAVVSGFLTTKNNAPLETKTVKVKDEDTIVLDGNPSIIANIYDSEKKEYVSEFVNVIAWRKLAENFAKAAKSGVYVIAVGTWQEREYDKADGSKGISKDLIIESFKVENAFTRDVLKANKNTGTKPSETKSDVKPADVQPQASETTGGAIEVADDDLPF